MSFMSLKAIDQSKRLWKKKEEIIQLIERDRYDREKIFDQITYECDLSRITIWRILRRKDYKKIKSSCKSKLTDEMKETRLTFCLLYKDWIIEDWKRIIWTDETAVILNHRRETVRIWRTKYEERHSVKSIIRAKWVETCEFMFWDSCYVIICKERFLSSKKHVQQTHFVFCRIARHDDKFVTRLSFAARIVWLTELDDNSTASFSLSNSFSYRRKDSSRKIWAKSETIDRDVWRARFADA
jgi:hypothetical protein